MLNIKQIYNTNHFINKYKLSYISKSQKTNYNLFKLAKY